ncbi:MAG: hypothetical protein KDJ29_19950 [Hyphomicrobiales bacterium]|nr:hypothetical protein [Hyphomicrobiales bacterium]
MQTFYKNAMRAIITIATALFLTSLAMLRAFAQDLPPNGPFFGGYEVKTGSPDIDISLDIDQLSGEDTGWGTINLFSKKVKPRCPENMADSFCRELGNRFANLGAEPKALDTERDGMLIVGNSVWTAFHFHKSREIYVFRLEMRPDDRRGQITLFTQDKDVVMKAPVERRRHFCEMAMCSADRLSDLYNDPEAAKGVFVQRDFVERFGNSSQARPRPQPSPEIARMDGEWTLYDAERNEILGTLAFEGTSGEGRDFIQPYNGVRNGVDLRLAHQRNEAYDFEVRYRSYPNTGRLLLDASSLASDVMRGTFNDVQQGLMLVEARRGSGRDASHTEPEAARDNDAESDLPGIGVSGPAYRLRGVPNGKTVKLRSGPSRSASVSGRLASDATELLVYSCTPAIDTLAFEQTNGEGKRDLLAKAWCDVRSEEASGYLPGLYLDPILDR